MAGMETEIPNDCHADARAENGFAGRIVALVALVHLALAACFVFSLIWAASSLASEAYRCRGVNLIEKLRADEPQKLGLAKAEALQTPNGDSIYWRISKDGIPDSFLYGTMHSPDPRITRLPDGVRRAFDLSSVVLIENVDALDPAKMAKAMIDLRQHTFLSDGTTLDLIVAAGEIPRLQKAVEARNVSWKIAKHMQPWLITATIAIPACDFEARQAGKPVLDAVLGEMARRAGKELAGLETIDEQFSAVTGVPEEFHVNALNETLSLGPMADDMMETTKLLYLEGDIAMILPIARQLAPETYQGHGYTEFRERVLTNRNRIMVERAVSRLEDGGAFMAVGALHLPGEQGLVSLLRGAGFTVEPEPL